MGFLQWFQSEYEKWFPMQGPIQIKYIKHNLKKINQDAFDHS